MAPDGKMRLTDVEQLFRSIQSRPEGEYLKLIVYLMYTMYIYEKNMSTITLSNKKRKNIDLSEETFRALSILASANGKNLKSFIETILDDEAKMLSEERIYREFMKDPESQEIVSGDEKATFENWLGLWNEHPEASGQKRMNISFASSPAGAGSIKK